MICGFGESFQTRERAVVWDKCLSLWSRNVDRSFEGVAVNYTMDYAK